MTCVVLLCASENVTPSPGGRLKGPLRLYPWNRIDNLPLVKTAYLHRYSSGLQSNA